MNRKINRIVIHCSAGNPTASAESIVNYHLRPVSRGGRGWKAPGYHYIVELSGNVVATLPEEKISNGAKGYNSDSIHICYTGGIAPDGTPKDTRSKAQKESLRALVARIRARRGLIPVVGHRDLSPDRDSNGRIDPSEWIKACPSFDVATDF